MKTFLSFLTAWGLAGLGAVIGSIIGNAGGKPWLFAGAVAGGFVGVWVAVAVLTKLRWLPADDRHAALIGGIVGFAIAAPIAVMNLHTPVTPVMICGLVGAGLLLGVRIARAQRVTIQKRPSDWGTPNDRR